MFNPINFPSIFLSYLWVSIQSKVRGMMGNSLKEILSHSSQKPKMSLKRWIFPGIPQLCGGSTSNTVDEMLSFYWLWVIQVETSYDIQCFPIHKTGNQKSGPHQRPQILHTYAESRPYMWIVFSKDNTPSEWRGVSSAFNCKELPSQCLCRKKANLYLSRFLV